MEKAQVSHTAWLVALSMATLAAQPRYAALVPAADAEFYRLALRCCRRWFALYKLVGLIPPKLHLRIIEAALMRGATLHFLLRKQFVAQQVAQHIDAGCKQLVVLGGGFDACALRTAKAHPDIACFELDLAPMHGCKRRIVQASGGVPSNLHLVACDLSRTPLHDVLAAHPYFSAGTPTLFVAEGLSMYLTHEAMSQLLSSMRQLAGRAYFVFSAIETQSEEGLGALGAQLQGKVLSATNERFSWSLPIRAMGDFLQKESYRLATLVSYAQLQRPWRDAQQMQAIEALPQGEYMVAAYSE